MAHYVVVRGDQSAITSAASAAGGTAGVGVAPIDAFGADVVEIVSFSDGDPAVAQQKAVDFSIKRPDWFGTVYDKQEDAEKNAVQRAEGQ